MAQVIAFFLLTYSLFPIDEETSSPKKDSPNTVFGLTIKSHPLHAKTLKQLAHIGIQYTFNTTLRPSSEPNALPNWDRGVLFLSDFENKEELLRKWFEQFTFTDRNSRITIGASDLD